MAKVSLSGMTVEALMDLRSGLTKPFTSVGPSLKSSWRGWAWLVQGFEVVEVR